MPFEPLANNPYDSHLTEDQLRRKKNRARRNLALIILALGLLSYFEFSYLRQQNATISDNIPVLLLFNVIIILLVLLVTLIARNLTKLYNERKSLMIGAKFQTKLILAFLTLALVPSVLLFFVASKLFSYSIGTWFSVQVEQSLQQSMEVAREYYSHVEKTNLFYAKKLEQFITNNQLYLEDRRDQLRRLTEMKVEEYQLGGIIIYDHEGRVVVSYASRSMPETYTNKDYSDLIQESMANETITEPRSFTKGNYMVVITPLIQRLEDKPAIWGYILTLSKIPQSTLFKIESIRNAFEEYKKQSFLKLPVSANYFVTFILMTLLILFSAIWLGFYMARGITVPIQELAQGTRRIAEGDLNFKVDVATNDEIGMLVNSFNSMTEELKQSRVKIDRVHKNLSDTNIELERRRYYTETILENIGAGVVSIDKTGIITTINKGAKRLLKMGDRKVYGRSYKEAFDPVFRDAIRNTIKQIDVSQQESFEKKLELTVGDSTRTFLVNIKFMRDSSGKYLGILLVFEDVTQLIKAQKISAWQEVAQGIAHEIKNPLTPIQLNTQRLRKKYYEDKKSFAKVFDESIRIITQEVEGMKDLLNEFLRFSRMPTPRPRPASIHQIIDDVHKLYKTHTKKPHVAKEFDPGISLLNIDPEQIRRVFINLFDNALDAIDTGGTLRIATRKDKRSGTIQVHFSDDGKGINPSDRDKLFLPHFTTKKRGTGLGLAIVTRIINEHNGSIQVADNNPKGTVFIIELPDTSTQAASPGSREPALPRTAPPA
ncbi:two-component system nitrogen regulation sensor histidine kinase NtrY [Nitrospina gracilis]|uniref:ATP-binding protein n=1 Tax=Nitrospina sp. Nb-3 TaxID=2940485 RepID=UPI001F314543|nr:ATP-binding protein [Nitrospina sp. Nb-3]MCF8724704.1 two-component system nitrogen regulation sensor histidine kinase NtrY [Nitrospina sp. Nb-3]